MTDYAKAALEARAEIDKERLKTLKGAGVTFRKVALELAAVAFANIDDYMTIADGGEIQARTFEEIKATKGGAKKLKAVKKVKEHTIITESKDGENIYKDTHLEYELYNKVDVLKYLVKLLGEEPADRHELIGAGGPIEVTATVRVIPSGAGSDKD
jgi:thymidylate synthase